MPVPRLARRSVTVCECGHTRAYHDHREGCIRFLCCDRTRNLFPGKRHTEHDFITHTVKPCLCSRFTPKDETV